MWTNKGAQQDQRVLTPNWFRKEAQKHRAESVKHDEEEAYERKKTNYSLGQNVCSLVPCSLLRDLLEHLHSPHWRGWEWDVAHSNSPSDLWQLQEKSRTEGLTRRLPTAQVWRRTLTRWLWCSASLVFYRHGYSFYTGIETSSPGSALILMRTGVINWWVGSEIKLVGWTDQNSWKQSYWGLSKSNLLSFLPQ